MTDKEILFPTGHNAIFAALDGRTDFLLSQGVHLHVVRLHFPTEVYAFAKDVPGDFDYAAAKKEVEDFLTTLFSELTNNDICSWQTVERSAHFEHYPDTEKLGLEFGDWYFHIIAEDYLS